MTYFIPLEKPLVFVKQENDYIIVQNYSFDKTMAKEGNTSLCVRFHSDFDWWNELYSDRDKYMEVKDNLAAQIIQQLKKHFKDIDFQIEAVDVAAPPTYTRYTNTWKGSALSWLTTTANFGKNLPKTLPGL